MLQLRNAVSSIATQVGALVLLSILVALISFANAYREVDAMAEQRQAHTLLTALRQQGYGLQRELKAETVWDDAFAATALRTDTQWLDDFFGTYITGMLGYGELMVLSAADRPIYAYPPNFAFNALQIDDLIAALRGEGESRVEVVASPLTVTDRNWTHYAVSDLRVVNGQPAIIVAETIMPDTAMEVDPALVARPPILIATLPMTAKFLDIFGQQTGFENLHWAGDEPLARGLSGLAVTSSTGRSVGTLVWSSIPAGQTILERMMPGLLVAALIIAGTAIPVIINLRRRHLTLARHAQTEAVAARTDHLTGLANRLALSEQLQLRLGHVTVDRMLAVVLVDLDGFKHLNDSLGHLAGDDALVVVGQVLANCTAPHFLARTGGDEFAFLMEIEGADEVAVLCDKIIAALSAPYINARGDRIALGCSIGYSLAPRHGTTYEELFRRADLALYTAKSRGRGRAFGFDESLESQSLRRARVELALRNAVQAGQIRTVYQPLLSEDGRAVIGVEALARWDDAQLGAVTPAEFIPIAEETGLIVQLGEAILRQAVSDAAHWHGLPVSVNVSAQQLQTSDFAATVARVIKDTGFPPNLLEIELTESSLIADEARARAQITALQALGVKVALDDFGTGYSSLLYLRRFSFDKIKLDRSFVLDSDKSHEARTLVAGITTMAHDLGLAVTAEGVENAEQARFLQEAGCDRLQGFFFSRPVPADDVRRFIAERLAA